MASGNANGDVEKKYVRDVYREIAPHFSDTRYKPWPKVKEFLLQQSRGSLVADIGCGNGKYHHVNPHSFTIGSDSCFELLEIAFSRGGEVFVGDCLQLPFRSSVFDCVISIAVVHHLSTQQRRVQAIQELCRITRPGGSLLVYVWAFERNRKKFDSQDVMVPWHLQPKYQIKKEDQSVSRGRGRGRGPIESAEVDKLVGYKTYQRYYHVFTEGELTSLFQQADSDIAIKEEYYDHENWCVVAVKR